MASKRLRYVNPPPIAWRTMPWSSNTIARLVGGLAAMALAGCVTPTDPAAPPATAAAPQEAAWRDVLRIADTTRAQGDLPIAAALYERAHRAAPGELAPLLELGQALWEIGAVRESMDAYRKAIAIAPADAEARRGLGRSFIALDQPLAAAEQYAAAIAAAPGDPDSYNGMGIARDLAGDHDDAQRHYRRGLAIDPGNLTLHNNLGFSLALAGDYGPAIALLREVVADPTATARHRQNLALVYGLAGDESSAARLSAQDLDRAVVESNLTWYRQARAAMAPDGGGDPVPTTARRPADAGPAAP